MNKKISKALLVIVYLSLFYFSYGQGCSDAGVCTMNSFKPTVSDSSNHLKNQIKFGISHGFADNDILVTGNYLEYKRDINNWFSIDTKITSLSQYGNGISVYGLSDVYISSNIALKNNLKITTGLKIPLTNGNSKKNGLSLPMDYQSSLGTLDLVLGAAYKIKEVQVIVALQQPLIQNSNQFFSEKYSINSKINSFQSTNQFQRSGDILLRISYPIKIHPRIDVTPSLLSIYHLSEDKYKDQLGFVKSINGSKGLTQNANLYFDYNINKQSMLQFNIGMPFIVRESRPDGLTRSFIAAIEYKVSF